LSDCCVATPVIRPPTTVDQNYKEMSDFCVVTPVIRPFATLDHNYKELSDSSHINGHYYVNLIFVWPCIINVGKVIQKNQLDASSWFFCITLPRNLATCMSCTLATFSHLVVRFLYNFKPPKSCIVFVSHCTWAEVLIH